MVVTKGISFDEDLLRRVDESTEYPAENRSRHVNELCELGLIVEEQLDQYGLTDLALPEKRAIIRQAMQRELQQDMEG